jgi:hypothetical protein
MAPQEAQLVGDWHPRHLLNDGAFCQRGGVFRGTDAKTPVIKLGLAKRTN